MDEALALQVLGLLGIEANSILEKPELLEDGHRVFYDFFHDGVWLERDVTLFPRKREALPPVWGELTDRKYFERYSSRSLLPEREFANRLEIYDRLASVRSGTSRRFWGRHSLRMDGGSLSTSLPLGLLARIYPCTEGKVSLLEQKVLIPAWRELGFCFGSAAEGWQVSE